MFANVACETSKSIYLNIVNFSSCLTFVFYFTVLPHIQCLTSWKHKNTTHVIVRDPAHQQGAAGCVVSIYVCSNLDSQNVNLTRKFVSYTVHSVDMHVRVQTTNDIVLS